MSNVQVAKDFFQQHLPALIQEHLDFNTLKLQPGSYIDKSLKHFASDILYQVNFLENKGSAYLYVLAEHQSSVDKLMPFRLWQYTTAIWNECLKKHKGDKLPLIIPLVFYNGPKKYDGPKDIRELVDAPQALIELFLFKPFQLIDAQAISDEALREKHWVGLMEFAMKHAYAKEALNYIQLLLELLKRVLKEGGTDYGASVLNYFLSQTETANPGQLLKSLETGLTQSEDNIMATVVDYLTQQYKETWLQTGKEEGIQQGLYQGIERGLHQGIEQGERKLLLLQLTHQFGIIPEQYLQKIESANSDMLLKWAGKLLEKPSLETLFDESV